MSGCGKDNGPGAIVRSHGEMPGFRHGGDFARFRKAAAPGQIKHNDSSGLGLEQIAKSPAAAERFRGAYRSSGRGGISFQSAEAVHFDRILVPKGAEWRESFCDGHGRDKLPHGMELDHNVDLVADTFSDFLEGLDRRSRLFRRRRRMRGLRGGDRFCRGDRFLTRSGARGRYMRDGSGDRRVGLVGPRRLGSLRCRYCSLDVLLSFAVVRWRLHRQCRPPWAFRVLCSLRGLCLSCWSLHWFVQALDVWHPTLAQLRLVHADSLPIRRRWPWDLVHDRRT